MSWFILTSTSARLKLLATPTPFHLGEFYLLPQFQNQGIGTVLLERVIAEATEKARPIRLEVLKNNPVLSLYLRHRFVFRGQREHHFLMERPVLARGDNAELTVESLLERRRNFEIEDDNYPIFRLIVENVGEQKAQVFVLLRQIRQISPHKRNNYWSLPTSRSPEARAWKSNRFEKGLKTRVPRLGWMK